MTLDKMIELAKDHATRVMVGSKAELTPAWLLITAKGDIEIFATPWGNNREKHLIIETMRDVMREKHATAYSMVTEAWMAHATAEEMKSGEYGGVPPSQRSDRQEAVAIMAANRDGEHRYQTLATVRGAEGKCVELRELSTTEDRFTGIFDNLLDDRRRAN
jgi:hypothetical protein